MNITIARTRKEYYYSVEINGWELWFMVRWTSGKLLDAKQWRYPWDIEIYKSRGEGAGWELVNSQQSSIKRPSHNDSRAMLLAFLTKQLSNLKQ